MTLSTAPGTDTYAAVQKNGHLNIEATRRVFEEALERVFLKALENGEVNGRGIAEGQYSIKSLPDGRQYVEIDVDQSLFDGLSDLDKLDMAELVIRERFMGNVIGSEEHPAFVNRNTAKEYAHPVKFLPSSETIDAKARASTELDNLLKAAYNWENHADGESGHQHTDAVGGFDHATVLFKVGDSWFLGRVNVKINSKGRLLKDITKIRETTVDTYSSYETSSKSVAHNGFSNTFIPQNGSGVNPYSMQDEEDYTTSVQDDAQNAFLPDDWQAEMEGAMESNGGLSPKAKNALLNPEKLTKATAIELMESCQNGLFDLTTFIPISRTTPDIVIQHSKKHIHLQKIPMVMNVDKVQQMIEEADVDDGGSRLHGIDATTASAIFEGMFDPQYIVYQADNNRIGILVKMPKGYRGMALVVLAKGRNFNANKLNGYAGGSYNVSVTLYSLDDVPYYLDNPENIVVYDKSKVNREEETGSHVPSLSNDSPYFDTTIAENSSGVNPYSMQDEEDYTTSVQDDGKYYRIVLSVGLNSGIATVYNIGQTKETGAPQGNVISCIGSKAGSAPVSNIFIPQNGSGVNPYSMQDEEDYTTSVQDDGQYAFLPDDQQAMLDGHTKEENQQLTDEDLEPYLQTGITQHTRNKKLRMLYAGKKPILTTPAEIKSFLSDVVHGRAGGEVRAFAKVGLRLANAIMQVRKTLNVNGNYLELNADALREAYKRHITPKEKGDIPLSDADFENIPQYLDTFDGVLSVDTYNDRVEIHLYKHIGDGYIRILTVSSKERNSLQVTKLIGVSKDKFERKYGKKIERDTGSPRSQTVDTEGSNPSTKARHTAGALSTPMLAQEDSVVKDDSADGQYTFLSDDGVCRRRCRQKSKR